MDALGQRLQAGDITGGAGPVVAVIAGRADSRQDVRLIDLADAVVDVDVGIEDAGRIRQRRQYRFRQVTEERMFVRTGVAAYPRMDVFGLLQQVIREAAIEIGDGDTARLLDRRVVTALGAFDHRENDRLLLPDQSASKVS